MTGHRQCCRHSPATLLPHTAVTFAAFSTKLGLYCLVMVTEAHVCEQLARSRYLAIASPTLFGGVNHVPGLLL